jgi:protein TonB
MKLPLETQVYLPREVAAAAGVLEEDVLAAVRGRRGYIGHHEAVALALSLRRAVREGAAVTPSTAPVPFALFRTASEGSTLRLPFAVSGTVHAALITAAIMVTSFTMAPAVTATRETTSSDTPRMVFLNIPGPGGGGGGSGLQQPRPPAKALRSGHERISSPAPDRQPPPPVEPPPAVPPPLAGETLPVMNAPVIAMPSDDRTRAGVLDRSPEVSSQGPGQGGAAGAGNGSGVGQGDGSGIGPGSGGGTGGGPYRPGSGITAPRVLREVKPSYTDEARHAGITGTVDLEVVVRRDGSVGDVRLLRGLGRGLDQRAIDAVRQWRFAPATRQGVAVDVIVEVAVEFSLR